MQTVERHGGGHHLVRPDRIYRTGVLAPTMNYSPTADAQAVAAEFTQYPINLMTPGLSGLGGVFDRLRMRIAMWKAKRRARSFAGFGNIHDPRYMPGGTYAQVGVQYAPQQLAKEQMVAHLLRGNVPPPYAKAQGSTSYQHFTNNWWNG